jgi:hypothetical protein
MPIFDDGDIVRAVGFLAIYFGNLEDEVDELISAAVASGLFSSDPDIGRRNFRDKLRYIKRGFAAAFESRQPYLYMEEDRRQVRSTLIACKEAAKRRNELMHLPIFGDRQGRGRTYQRLRDGTMNQIYSRQIYELANRVSDLGGAVYGMTFVLSHIQTRPEAPTSGQARIG